MIGEMLEAHSQAVASTGTEVAPPPVAHTARWAPNAYLINCLHAVQQPLRQFPAAVPLVESLAARAAQLADEVVEEGAAAVGSMGCTTLADPPLLPPPPAARARAIP